jgi:uncharacterized protein (TIGR03083 family)
VSGKSGLKNPEPILIADLFPEILEGLLALLSDLGPDDWSQPTVCWGWSAKDVALHLLGIEIGNLSYRRDGFDYGVPVEGWEALVGSVNNSNQSWVEAARRISPELLIDLLRHIGSQTGTYFQSLDPFALGGGVSWVGPGPVPVWLDLAREYTERWHHQQHIRDAVGKPGFKQPRYLAPVLATFAWAMPHAFLSTGAGESTCVTLTVSGEAGGRWSVVWEGGNWQLYSGAPDRPAAEVVMDEDTAWRLFTRGVSQDQEARQITIQGDRSLGLRLLEMVAIIA